MCVYVYVCMQMMRGYICQCRSRCNYGNVRMGMLANVSNFMYMCRCMYVCRPGYVHEYECPHTSIRMCI